MGKRTRPQGRDADQAKPFKRPKVVHEAPTSEEIVSAGQLRQLLAFDQDPRKARHGLQSLKIFLDKVLFTDGDHSKAQALFRDYLDAVKPRHLGEDAVYLPDIFSTWSLAARTNDESLMSAVAVALHLTLQCASRSLDLLPHGLGICQTILQEDHIKLVARNLSPAEASRSYVLSPTLRLLREVASLDGGAYARRMFRARNFTFSHLAENLEVVVKGQVEDPKKPYVRTNAVRFLLACLKFLDAESKKELLTTMRNLASRLVFLIAGDPAYLVVEILHGLSQHVVLDERIPRDVKFRCFNTKTLVRLSALYDYKLADAGLVIGAVHDFLTLVCTNPEGGILIRGTGLYPKDLVEDLGRKVESWEDASLDTVVWMDKFKDEIPVANFVLGEFIQTLRPWSSMKHSELLVSIFGAAPELLSYYFVSMKAFSFDPKLTMTWIGYGAFLFSTMQLPIPQFFGHKAEYFAAPPPTSILLDNIIPLPLNQKNLSKCLTGKSPLAAFFAIRLTTLAIQKLGSALTMYQKAGTGRKRIWSQGAIKLKDEVYLRIPDLKSIMLLYKATPDDSILHREAISRLLLLYFEVLPQLALDASFDVSPFLVSALARLRNGSDYNAQDRELIGMELENLLSIASYSSGMRWFAKIEGLKLSTFATLLQLLIDSATGSGPPNLGERLDEVAQEHQLTLKESGLNPLVGAFKTMQRPVRSMPPDFDLVWSFLDNCLERCAAAPKKYQDMLQTVIVEVAQDSQTSGDEFGNVSLLMIVMLDQLPFALRSGKPEGIKTLAMFLAAYVGCSALAGECGNLTGQVLQKMEAAFSASNTEALEYLDVPEDLVLENISPSQPQRRETSASRQSSSQEPDAVRAADPIVAGLEALLDEPQSSDDDNSAMVKWVSKTVEDLVEEGHAASLIRLLVSPHISIRKEALTNVLKMAAKIRESAYEERDQVWLLLAELAESSRDKVGAGPVPSAFVGFAVHALEVLRSPLHPLYTKVNRFLTKRPVWHPESVPLADDVLNDEPSDDDKHYAELGWLLPYLLDCLRTPADAEAFRRRQLWEPLLALLANPCIRGSLRTRVLRIVYRATGIEGASTTLVQRFGGAAWLEEQIAGCGLAGEEGRVMRALARRVWETCDRERAAVWSQGGLREEVISRM